MSDNYTADSEKFEIVHKMSRRIASVDIKHLKNILEKLRRLL